MKRFKHILLVINDDADNEAAISQCVTLAKQNKAKLTLMSFLEESNSLLDFFESHTSENLLEMQKKTKIEHLNSLFAPYAENVEYDLVLRKGKAFYEIIKAVLRHDYDLVVKTCEMNKVDLGSLLFGSTDMHLLRKCPCPVWLIKPKKKLEFKRILAAMDLEVDLDAEKMDALNRQIIEMSTSLSQTVNAELHIVFAWFALGEELLELSDSKGLEKDVTSWMEFQKNESQRVFDEFKATLDDFMDVNNLGKLQPQLHFLEGDPCEVIPSIAEEKDVDLVVMGTVARAGIPGFFMGNTAESILSQLNCSVLAVKPEGFVSPVTL